MIDHDKQLRNILTERDGETSTPRELFYDADDSFWLWANTEGYRLSDRLQQVLPSMPDEAFQSKFVGGSGDAVMNTGFNIYKTYRSIIEEHSGNKIDQAGKILDFGVGWGRILRLFLRDFEPNLLYGTDVNEHCLNVCRMTNKWCKFDQNNALPPTQYQDSQFSVVYSFSVFSHLGEMAHENWLKEFHRILRPGGLMIASTWHRDFIQWCADSRAGTSQVQTEGWKARLAPIFRDTQHWFDKYDNGEFCFEPYARDTHPRAFIDGEPSHGETCISKGYVMRNWTKLFNFVDFIDDKELITQNVIVMRK